jgi:hypothetical protein
VARVPYDPHLEEGAEVDLAELKGDTRYGLLELAAAVADGFPREGIAPDTQAMAARHPGRPAQEEPGE